MQATQQAPTSTPGPATNVAVRIEKLCKTYRGAPQRAVNELDLTIGDGQIFTLLGPSGCGKSTTLRIVAGLEHADEGTIHFAGRPVVDCSAHISVQADKRGIGMVFQSYAIWPHMTVEQNVAFPLRAQKFPKSSIPDRVARALELVGMGGYQKRPGPLLSGGQQQRVALARALVTEPKILLLDEPFSNLDAKLREQMRLEVKQLQERLGFAVLFVTHDQVEALSLSDEIAVMKAGQIQQVGNPRELYEQPANEFVRDFVGSTLLFNGRVEDVDAGGDITVTITGDVPCTLVGRSTRAGVVETGATVALAVRPEDVEILPGDAARAGDNFLPGIARAALFAGQRVEYQVEIEGQPTMVLYGNRYDQIDEGTSVWLRLRKSGHTVWMNGA